MSYETTYSLSWDGTSPTKEEMAQALAENVDGSTPGQQDYEDVISGWMEMLEGDITETRWESREKDIAKISMIWPGTLFMLSMQGEQGGSHQDYYLNGLVQTVQGEIVFPPFQPEHLREPK